MNYDRGCWFIPGWCINLIIMRLSTVGIDLWLAHLCSLAAGIALAATIEVPASLNERQVAGQQISQGQPVALYLTVRDKEDRIVTDLGTGDVRLFEDGEEQKIDSLWPANYMPVAIGLLIDTSGTRRNAMPGAEKDAAIEFFRLALRKEDRSFVAAFSDAARPGRYFSNDLSQIEQDIQLAISEQPRGSTSTYDAIVWACEKMLITWPGRRMLIVVSDNGDNASRNRIELAIERALRSQTTVYFMIPTSKQLSDRRGYSRFLGKAARISAETGGTSMNIPKKEVFLDAFNYLAADLQSGYALRYVPLSPRKRGKFHKIKIETVRPGMKIYVPQGYYEPKK